MNTNHIDISAYFKEQAKLLESVGNCSRALENAQAELHVRVSAITLELQTRIKNGDTTGDKLQDEFISCCGFNKERIQSLLSINRDFMARKGEQFLIVHEFKERVFFGGPQSLSDRDFEDQQIVILGEFSGEQIKISGDGVANLSLMFPFARYVQLPPSIKHGLVQEAEYAFTAFGKPGAHEFLNALTSNSDEPRDGFDFVSGAEAIAKSVNHSYLLRVRSFIIEAQKLLAEPTPAEQVKGSGTVVVFD